jgi:hypothetical protein
MVKFLATLILSCLSWQSFAQQAKNWYFPENAGIRFDAQGPHAISGGKLRTSIPNNLQIRPTEAGATLSDSKGNLLFYTDGVTVWNRNHQPMKRGQQLKGGLSATQPATIVPDPANPSRFYIFTVDDFQHILRNGLCYSVVDMCLDNGLGDITEEKNIFMLDLVGEKQAITKHQNDTDYWLVVHKHYTRSFYAYKISAAGISRPVISTIGSYHGGGLFDGAASAIGQMKIAPDGKRIGLVNTNNDLSNDKALLEVFNFDNETGKLSNYINLTDLIYPIFHGFYGGYGFAFSPSGDNVFMTSRLGLFQFHFNGVWWSYVNKIEISSIMLNPAPGMQLGPDGKIYMAKGESFLASIGQPEHMLPDIAFVLNDVWLDEGIATWSLPSFYDGFRYTQKDPTCSPASGSSRGNDDCGFALYPNPFTSDLTLKLYNTSVKDIRFYNPLGQLVWEYLPSEQPIIVIDTKDLRDNFYVVVVTRNDDTFCVQKLVKSSTD